MTMPLISRLLVAISGSEASIDAAKVAIIMAKQYKCELSAVYVVDTATLRQLTLSRIFIQEESAEYQQSLEANGERYLSYIEELAESKGVSIDTELRHGAVCTEILNFAKEREIDLIILGGYEKGRNPRDIISHSHREVLVNSRCSVYIVKEPEVDLLFNQA